MEQTEKPTVKNKGGRHKGVLNNAIFKFVGKDNQEYKLTELQKKFSELFIQYRGDGTEAIIDAGYQCFYPNSQTPNRAVAAQMAYENLKKVDISAYVYSLIEDMGLNNSVVDTHLYYNISQFADLNAKNKAIDIYHKLRGNYAPEKHEVGVAIVEVTNYGKAKPVEE